MSQAIESREAEGVAEARARRKLTNSVGRTLVRRSRLANFKWSTWKVRLGASR
ncbi:MAG: hypothetical protein ACXVRS_02995 [Gaiellaceae bacterium]